MKLNAYIFVAFFLLGILATSCGKTSVSLQGANSNVIDSNLQKDLFVWVENARVRKEPDLKSEVITELKGGEKLILTGEVSTTKIKINLRGVEFEDVWVKVKTAAGNEGWVFKGMLTEDESKASAMNDFLIQPGKSVGRINVGATKDEVANIFGKEFITNGEIYIGEGESRKGFYLFKNSNLELQCSLDENNKIVGIYIREPGGNWTTAEGIRVGTTLDELTKINEEPIKFSGFGWDFGGAVYDYNRGKLERYDSNLSITLGEPDSIEGLDAFMGDVECTSADKRILGKGVKVAEIVVFGALNL